MNSSGQLSKSNIFRIFYFIFIAGMLFPSCRHNQAQRVIKLAHGLDITHPVHIAMKFMADRVETTSGGAMRMQIYPNQQLGDERQCLELLQIGSIAMTKVSAAVMEGFVPVFKVLSLPYIFRGREHSFQVLDGPVGRELLLKSEKFRLRGMGYYDAGSRSFYTKNRPIYSPADLKGLKIRVQSSNTSVNMVQQLGGAATPIAWGELYTALQGGVVDGAENNPPSFYLSHHYEVCKYYILNEHTTIPDVLLISTRAWNSLSPEEQTWLQDAVDESIVFQRKIWAEAEQEALRAPSSFTDELARYLLIWVGILGAAYATGQRLHLGIDIVAAKVSLVNRVRLAQTVDLAVAFFAVLVMIIGGTRLVYISLKLKQTSAALRLPLGYLYLVVPVSGLLILFYSIMDFFNRPAEGKRTEHKCGTDPGN